MTPSGTISCACWAAEPCQTPSVRVALPLTAAAIGTVQSTRSWPSLRASRRLFSVSDWARKGTVRKTIGPALRGLGVLEALDLRVRDLRDDLLGGLRGPLGLAGADHDLARRPRPAHRQAVAERAGAADDRDGVAHGGEPVYSRARPGLRHRLPRDAARGEKGAGHGRRQRHRRGDRAAARRRRRRGDDRRPQPGGRHGGRRRDLRAGGRARRDRLASAQAAVDSAGGTLDILINNAGTDEFGFFVDMTPERWEKVIAVNLTGVFNCTHAALPGDAGGQLRANRQHRLRGRPRRLQGIGRLLGRQGRRHRLHQGDRPRGRALRDQRQRRSRRARSRRRC